MQPTVTIADTLHVTRVLHTIASRISRTVRVGKRRRAGKVLPKSMPHRVALWQGRVPTLPQAETLQAQTTVFQASCAGRGDNQRAGEQGRPLRQYVSGHRSHNSTGALLANKILRRMAMKKIRKIKKMRPKVSSYLNIGTTAYSITCTDARKTLKHKRAKRQKQQEIHRLRIHQLPG